MTSHLTLPPAPSRPGPPGVVGVSGGVGTSTVAVALGGRDLRVFTGRPGDVVVCRGTVASVLLAGRVVAMCDRPVVAVTAVDAARPGAALQARLELLEPHTAAVVLLPYVPQWRDAVDPLAELRRQIAQPREGLPRPVRHRARARLGRRGDRRGVPGMSAPTPPVCDVFDLGCKAQEVAGQLLAGLAAQVAQGAADLIVTTAAWWAGADSVDPRDAAVLAAQQATTPLALALLVGGVLVQAVRMILSRKAEPLAAVAAALLRFAAVSALGLTVLHLALQAGDALARQLLGDAANNFALFMVDALTTPVDSAFGTLLVSATAAGLSLVQWMLMALRQAGLLVLAAMLPLAAAGPPAWLRRLLAWLLALAAYKPVAAFIYYIGFSYLSSTSANTPGGIATQVTGLMVLLLAVLAMPVLMRFFSWSGSAVAGGGSGSSAFAGAAGAVALAPGLVGSSGVQQAAALAATGPGTGSTATAVGAAAGQAARAGTVAGAAVAAGTAAVQATGTTLSSGAPEPGDGSGR